MALNSSQEVTRVLKQVADIAFAPPYDTLVDKGGLSGLRKAIATEKNRFVELSIRSAH